MPLVHNSFHRTPAHDPYIWLLYVILPHDPYIWLLRSSAHPRSWVIWATLHAFAKSTNFLKCQRFVLSIRDVLCNVFCSRWASPSINLVCLLDWLFYNSKCSIPNGSASLFGKKNRRLLVTSLELTILPVEWADLVLAKALLRIFVPAAKMNLLGLFLPREVALPHNSPLWHVLLHPIPSSKWPEFMLVVASVKTRYHSSTATMNLLNKL